MNGITMKYLIVEPSPLPIRIPLGPKYSPRDPVLDARSLRSSLNDRRDILGKWQLDRNPER